MLNVLDYAPPVRKRFPWKWAAVFVFVGWWGSVVLGPLWLVLLPLALVCSVALAILKKWRWLLASLLLSPMAVSALAGTVAYARGTASFRCMGLMRYPVNVDPATRLQWSSGGCMVSGNEWMTQEPYNLAVLACLHFFGPMPGSYTGPYPSEADAYAALPTAAPLDLAFLQKDQIQMAGKTFSLRPALGQDLLSGFQEGPGSDPADPALVAQYGQPQATLCAGTCIIVAIPAQLPAAGTENRVVILIDATTGKAFAIYRPRIYYRPSWRSLWQ